MDEPNQNTPAALTTTSIDANFPDKPLNNRLRQQEALAFASSDPELFAFTILAQQHLPSITPQTGPHTPPSAIPPFAKPNSKSSSQSKGKKRGGQPGHPGKLAIISIPQIVQETINCIIALNAKGNWLLLESPEVDAVKIYLRI